MPPKFDYKQCMENNHDPIKFYCQRCKGPVCQTCFDTGHKVHSVTPYRDYLYAELRGHWNMGWLTIDEEKIEKIEAVESEMLPSLQLASKVIAEYEKKLTELATWQKKKDQLQEREAKNRKLLGVLHQVKIFSQDKLYDVDLKNVELCLQEESGNVLMKMVKDYKTDFEETFGPIVLEISFVVTSPCCSSSKLIYSSQFFRYGNHRFRVSAKRGDLSGITLSMSWHYAGDKKDLEKKTFFFSAEISHLQSVWTSSKASCNASNKTSGIKHILEADFCNGYASAHTFQKGTHDNNVSCFPCCGSFEHFYFECSLKFGFHW